VSIALRDALKAAHDGTLVGDERQTVADFLARWLHDVARTRVRPRTFAGYEAAIEHHLRPHLDRVRLTKLTPQHLQTWMATLEDLGVSRAVAGTPAPCCGWRSIRRDVGAW
jgi:integrase-like protein